MSHDVIHNLNGSATLGKIGVAILSVNKIGTIQKIDGEYYPNASGLVNMFHDTFHDGHIPVDNLLDGVGIATSSGVTQVIAAQGEDERIYVTYLSISNPTAFNNEIKILDGSTTKTYITAPANAGAISNFEEPLRLSANSPLQFSLGSGVKVSAVGYRLDY